MHDDDIAEGQEAVFTVLRETRDAARETASLLKKMKTQPDRQQDIIRAVYKLEGIANTAGDLGKLSTGLRQHISMAEKHGHQLETLLETADTLLTSRRRWIVVTVLTGVIMVFMTGAASAVWVHHAVNPAMACKMSGGEFIAQSWERHSACIYR